MNQSDIGHLHYIVSLFLFSGFLMLRFDAKLYKLAGMNKEHRLTKALGWVNIAIGIAVFCGSWLYEKVF